MPSCWFGLRIFVAHLRRFSDYINRDWCDRDGDRQSDAGGAEGRAKTTNSPFAKTDPKSLKFSQGRVHAADQPPDSGVRFQEILLANNLVGPDGQRIPLRPSASSAVSAAIALDAKKKKGSH